MNLLPNKNSHPDLTILAVSAFLIKMLSKSRIEKYSDLYASLEKYDKRAVNLFNPALNLLFSFGVIEYHSKNDVIEWLKK